MARKRKIYIAISLVLALGFIANGVWGGGGNLPVYETITAEKKNIASEVSITGRVKAAESVDLAFVRSGRVSGILAKVGNKVSAGQNLLTLESRQISAEIARAGANIESARAGLWQYEAALNREQARLDELKRGSRSEEIAAAENRVASAKRSLDDARINVDQTTNKATVDLVNTYEVIRDLLRDSYAKADDAVSRQTDLMFSNDTDTNPKLTFSTSNGQREIDIISKRVAANGALDNLSPLVNSQSSNLFELEEALRKAKQYLLVIRDYLQGLNDVVLIAVNLTSAQLDSYRTSISLGLTNVNTTLAGLNSQEQKIAAQRITSQNILAAAEARVNDAKAALSSAEADLVLKRAGASEQELQAQEANIKQAEANVSSQRARVREAQAAVLSLQAQLSENILTAPFSGTVTRQEAKIGEIVSPGAPLVSLIAEAKFEIELDLPEVDIAKIALQNEAGVTLDAYGDDAQFKATVIAIDPAATIIEGVPTYTVRLQFTAEDERIKPGMTANVIIFADKRENVLAIPQRAIIEDNGQKSVRVLRGAGRKQKVEEIAVTTGLRGSDGSVEILSGIQEGDRVITGETEK